MEKKHIILVLIIIFFILILSVKCNENFESNFNNKPLTTKISNNLYCIIDKYNNPLLQNYEVNSDYAKIYEFYNINNIIYYNVYFNEKILRYIDQNKVYFVADEAEDISKFPDYYKLYKTNDNKLYYIINNINRYLSIDNNKFILSDNEKNGVIWNF
jgi:hypothetical protein